MKIPETSKVRVVPSIGASNGNQIAYHMKKKIVSLLSIMAAASLAQAADISWIGGTADYTNAASWAGGVVPGSSDSAINDNGTNNAVRISVGNPDWAVNQIRAGNGAGDGAFTQNGQAVTATGTNSGTAFLSSVRLGIAAGGTGLYNFNGGSINYSNGGFNIGELGTGILNINGGTIAGSGNFADNFGSAAIPAAVNATVGAGVSEGDFTWFEQGLYTPNGSLGLPAAGSTIVSLSQADHSFNLPPSYTVNDDVMVEANVPNATITLTPSALCTSLSFFCMAGNGATTVSYVVHHADSTTETGTLSIPDWFGPGTAAEVMTVGARVDALGINFQFPGTANGFVGNAPYIWSLDIPVTHTGSAVTSIDLTYVSGGVANIFGVSSQTTGGGAFSPLAISGYNKDAIVEAGAVTRVPNSVTDFVNHTNGAVTITGGGQLFVGNVGNGIYNLIGGSIDVANNISVGRSGGNGTLNLAGGTFTERGGSFRVGDGGVGVLNQTGGTLVTLNNEFWIGQSSTGNGTLNLSSGTMIVSNWLAVGREGAAGVLNISGGSLTKAGGGNITITHGTGASGTVNQTGGSFTCASGETWIGEDSAAATWNMSAGTANLGVVHIVQNASATGTLNLNGGVMTLQELTTGNASGVSVLTLNGGTLQPSANNANFLHDITVVNVSSGGAIFDSAGFNITVSQPMPNNGGDGSGGLTKNGLGTLTLTGANSYAGPTVVNAGTLVVGTSSFANGGYTVANNAGLSIIVQSANAQLNAASLSTIGAATASLSFDLDGFGNPVSAPLNVTGTWTATGTVTINVADAVPQLGQFPLIKYGVLSGAPTLILGSIPTGVSATLVNNTANNSVDLNITGINLPRWDGEAGGTWDIGVTTNWVNSGTSLPTFYGDGNAVLFDDNAAGTTTVNLTTTVNPLSVTVNNTNLVYTITGTGKITGGTGLVKQGPNALSVLNTGGNNYTGPTTIAGGTLSVTNLASGGSPSAIGASSANPTNLVFSGGKLSYAGAPVSINRGYTVTADGSALETVGNLTLSGVVRGTSGTFNKTGLGQLTYTGVSSSNVLCDFNTAGSTYLIRAGTVVLDGSAGAQINISRNLNVGADAGVDAAIILTNTTLNTRSLQLGNNANCTGTLILNSNATMTVAANNFAVGFSAGTASAGIMIQNPGSVIDSAAELWAGQGPLSIGTYNMNGGLATYRNWVSIGRAGGTATLNMSGGAINKGGNGNFLIGSSAGNNSLSTTGTLNQVGGTITSTNEYWLGENALDYGTNNISGTSVLNWLNWVSIGRHGHGTVNFSSGTITRSGGGAAIVVGDNVGGGGNGFFNQTGGTLTSANELWIGQGSGAIGRYDLSAGTVTINNWVAIARGGAASGVLNMSGGSFTKTGNGGNHLLVGTGGPGTINQTGGTITSVLSDTYIGDNTTGIWNLDGGSAVLSVVHISQNNGVSGTLNLDTNGTATATEITTGNAGGNSTLNINSGTLIAGNGANPNFLHGLTAANLQNGVAVIDSGTNIVNISQALLNGAGGGALTKVGNGTLRLNGVNTYAGATLVSVGTLGGTGTIAGPVNVASGATLAPGASIGTLTINNSLTLSNSSTTFAEVSLDGGVTNNDLVTGLTGVTYAGSLVVTNVGTNSLVTGNVFKLFNSAAAGTGNFASVTILPAGSGTFNPATGEVTITSTGAAPILSRPTISNGNLILTGTGNPGAGYTVLSSTNITLPLAQWDTNTTGTFSGTGAASNAIPLNATNRFFLLRVP
jgi:autotransporter-associated beta strand protein